MSHRAQRPPPRLQLEAPPPDPEEKHDCRNTIIKCLREQISQLKYIVELQKELRMGAPYTKDPRGIEDTIITTIGRIETKIDALYNMVNGLTISVGDLRSEVRGKTGAGGGPSGPGTSTRTKGKDSAHQLFPIWESTWEEKGEYVEMDFWGTERPSVSGKDRFSGAAPPIPGITQKIPQQKIPQKKSSNLDGKNTVSKTSCCSDDVVIPATNYSSWQSDPVPKPGVSFVNDWSFGDNELLNKEPASGREDDDWGPPPVNWNSWPHKQPTSGQRKDDWGFNDFPPPGKQPANGEKFVGYYSSSDQYEKKPEKPNTSKDVPVSFWSESSVGKDQSDSKRMSSTTGDKASVSATPRIQVLKVMNMPQKQQQAPVQTHTRTSNSVSVNKTKNKWAATVETDHGESNDDGRDTMPGGWPPTQSQSKSKSKSQIETESKPPVTPENKPKARIEITGVSSGSNKPNKTNNNVKDKKEVNQIPTWDRKGGDEKADEWGSTWDSNTSSEGWVVDQEKEKGKTKTKTKIEEKDKDKENGKGKSKTKEKESSQKKYTRPANENYDNETEWASTQPWTDESDADTISPYKYGGTW